MVKTRAKNKDVHPAAPVMSNKAKLKIGIPAKRPTKNVPKNEQIRILEARLAAYQNPGDSTSLSKEPLVS